MPHSLQKMILVVEDDRDIRDAMVELMRDEGYSVEAASNGEEALNYLRSHQAPHLILLDLMMPVKDGFQFRQEQERDPALARIPVVIMTADGQVEAKKIRIKAKGFIRKPLDINEAIEVIRQCLG